MNAKAHWEATYKTRPPSEVSWFQREPALSLSLARRVAPDLDAAIVDVGGGASTLVDGLLSLGYRDITVIDVSAAALAESRRRLGADSVRVTWIEGDILDAGLALRRFDLWHDRALFHFLTSPADRARYLHRLSSSIASGGHVVMATFAEDGPTRCSGLPVVRYSPAALQDELGDAFRLTESVREEHVTPVGVIQKFLYCVFQAAMMPSVFIGAVSAPLGVLWICRSITS